MHAKVNNIVVQGGLQPVLRAAQHDAEVWLGKGHCWHAAVRHACSLQDVFDRPSRQVSINCIDSTTRGLQATHPMYALAGQSVIPNMGSRGLYCRNPNPRPQALAVET